MKHISLIAVLLMFTLVAVSAPDYAFAKKGGDDNHSNSQFQDDDSNDDDSDEDSDDDSNDDDSSDDEANGSLEIEADVFTDMTIVKVELSNSDKTVFSTDADTRAEVVAVVVERFNLTASEVEAVLDLEVEDRASRAKDRAKLTGENNKPIKVCVHSTSTSGFSIEADVFTDTTIVKVETNGSTTVFETSATTSDSVVTAIAARFTSLTTSQIKSVLDFEVEDRASRAKDFRISANDDSSDDKCEDTPRKDEVKNPSNSGNKELLSRIEQLQKLVETLISLLTARLGTIN